MQVVADELKVIIVDDHTVVRQGLRQILASEPDMRVVAEAGDATGARRVATEVDWDLMILDYAMPGSNGAELLKDLRRGYPLRPILVLSVHPEDSPAAVSVVRAGASGYLSKETVPEELTAAVRKAASGRKYIGAQLAERLAFESGDETQSHSKLSDREYRIMWLIASGKPIKTIAADMRLSQNTVSTYRARILKKLGIKSNAALVRYAIKHSLV